MANTWTHRRTVRQELYDFDAAESGWAAPLSSYDYRGAFPTSRGPTETDANGNQVPISPGGGASPKWFLVYDLPQREVVESYGDGTVARGYDMRLDVWAEPDALEDVFELAGAQLETYFAALALAGYSFRTEQLAVQPGVAQAGGFSGRSVNLPVEAS